MSNRVAVVGGVAVVATVVDSAVCCVVCRMTVVVVGCVSCRVVVDIMICC